MKTAIRSFVAAFLFAVSSSPAQQLGRLPGVVFASDRGPREAATLNEVISAAGTRNITIVLDGGSWGCSEAVSFPSTIALVILPGAKLNVFAGTVVTINGPLLAGDYEIFEGDGYVVGPAMFGYRYESWGATNKFDVGEGEIVDVNIGMDDPLELDLDQWYTNTVPCGGYLTAYAGNTNDGTTALSVLVVPSSAMTPTTTVAKASSTGVVSVNAAVPYGYLYKVVSSNATQGAFAYYTGLHQE